MVITTRLPNSLRRGSNNRGDPPRDDFLYQQIVFIYIGKAYKQAKTRSESIEKAAWNLDKAQNLHGDTYTAYGKTFSLERLQSEITKHLDEVRTKFSSAGCEVN
jgi:hypothetical protein